VRQILEEEGYPSDKIYKVAGNANTDPLCVDGPAVAPSGRVTITLRREALPPDLQQ
jgi:chemotaxis protein MotB